MPCSSRADRWSRGGRPGNADGYLGTIGRPQAPRVEPDMWVRTPPNFGAAIEAYWDEVQSFTLASNDECKPVPPVPYSKEVGSPFWTQANVVYETSFAVTDQQRQLALFWRDNPDGSTGLPSGHWLAIAATVIADQGLMLDRAAEVMALSAIAGADGFTSCWTEKYETNLLRPVASGRVRRWSGAAPPAPDLRRRWSTPAHRCQTGW